MNQSPEVPVLVGMGTATRRENDFHRALEPMDLMLEAVAAAGQDSTSEKLLGGLQFITVPSGRWRYSNPAGEIARAHGAVGATTVLTSVGVLQESLIADACARVARGEVHTALIAGADSGFRVLRAQIAGEDAPERIQGDEPDMHLRPKEYLRHPAELRAGLNMPVGLYAILESAYRARKGWALDEHRDRIAKLYQRFTEIAANNPHAWKRDVLNVADIREASAKNPMQAFPYTRNHCSTWNVDQAGALLLCSTTRAEELGIPKEKWVYPVVSTESNHMVPVSARKNLGDCAGARITGQAALEYSGLSIEDIDLIDLYSCFPVAVQLYAESLGLASTTTPTLTGGMAFAGGPYNNYFLQSTCRAIELMRAGAGRNALLSCVSGILTKQAFTVWSLDRPTRPFANLDLTEEVARETPGLEVVEDFNGSAKVAGYTVLHGRGAAAKGVVLLDTEDGLRVLATTELPGLIETMEKEDLIGRSVRVSANEVCELL
jgi:acetyl-CoA C-acetyltransferase